MALPVNVSKDDSKISHPYYPLECEIVGYLANDMSVPLMLFYFFAGCGVIFGGTHVIVKRVHPHLARSELFTIMWFVLSKLCSSIG